MQREFIDIAKQAVDEEWDAFKIMAEFTNIQKETDAKLCELNGYQDMAELIRQQ